MAKYCAFLGVRVRVEYRAGELQLPAVGKLVADSGKSIFLEERIERNESVRTFRWEIPYQCLVKIGKAQAESPVPANTNEADAGVA